MNRAYQVSTSDVYSLGTGVIGERMASTLRSARVSRNLLLLHLVYRENVDALRSPFEVLCAADAKDPIGFQQLLSEPWLTAWATQVLRGSEGQLEYLSSFAAMAAIRAKIETNIAIQRYNGMIILPSLGAIQLPIQLGEPAAIIVEDQAAAIRFGDCLINLPNPQEDSETTSWLTFRIISASRGGKTFTLTVDDLDPQRDCYGMTVADRLSQLAIKDFENLVQVAWQLIVDHIAASADYVCFLQRFVPLKSSNRAESRSGTTVNALGAFSSTLPLNATQLAVTMVHEARHTVLGLMHDLIPLHVSSSDAAYRVPWRLDLRPIGALLHGTYAFSGVAEAWKCLRDVPYLAEMADCQFTATKKQAEAALSTLLSSHELTPAGHIFVEGIEAALRSC